jgi:hypothetical protein
MFYIIQSVSKQGPHNRGTVWSLQHASTCDIQQGNEHCRVLFHALYCGENLSLALLEKHRLWAFDRVQRRIFGPAREETETGENCIRKSFIIYTANSPNMGSLFKNSHIFYM